MSSRQQASAQPVFGRQLGFGKRAALLVIDLTRAFTEPGRPLASDVRSVIAAANRLIDKAHERGQPVIFTTVFYDAPDFSDAGTWALKIGGQDDLRAGSNGSEIDPRLHRVKGDSLLVKKYASCFFGTDLSSRLTSLGVDTLVVCGVSTSGCVRATVVDAIQSGFRPIVAEEAVGDRWPEAHRQSLADLQAKYADVLPIDTVCDGMLRVG
ncbi:isochorismatase family protein [Aquibium sp. LZ166]|uniref:Isochorismatase family protein n=1 Tax=Aquibium pacificus TaxID=3153579 RepID=A0ABV3SKI0_9HYPH